MYIQELQVRDDVKPYQASSRGNAYALQQVFKRAKMTTKTPNIGTTGTRQNGPMVQQFAVKHLALAYQPMTSTFCLGLVNFFVTSPAGLDKKF